MCVTLQALSSTIRTRLGPGGTFLKHKVQLVHRYLHNVNLTGKSTLKVVIDVGQAGTESELVHGTLHLLRELNLKVYISISD